MHKTLPKFFIFVDKYDSQIFKNNNINFGIIYRNYTSKKRGIELDKIAKACKRSKKQLFISNDIKLVLKVKAEGLYIPSYNNKNFLNLEKKNIKIIGSAHDQKEIQKKISQKCKTIFLSPIFHIKKKNNFLGLHKFNYLTLNNKVNFYALGGISSKNIKKLNLSNSKGCGGITMFKKKTGLREAGFIKKKFF